MPERDRVRTAEVVAALSLATDLGTGLPLEHGLRSTSIAMRLCEHLGLDEAAARETYYGSLLFYVGCTADAEIVADLFPDDRALVTHFTPVMFGSPAELLGGLLRALSMGPGPGLARAARAVRTLPRAVAEQRRHLTAICEVGRMLSRRLGLPPSIQAMFTVFTERWDGRGGPNRVGGGEIPMPVRVVHVARDAAFHEMLGGAGRAARVVEERAGGAFDPEVARCLVAEADDVLTEAPAESSWPRVLDREPGRPLLLDGEAVDEALCAMGDFADLVSPYLVGHSAGVAALAGSAAECAGLPADEVVEVRRAALLHDLGRVATPARIWQQPDPLTTDDWERVRLHAYHSERVLSRSRFLAPLGVTAGAHHERMDGSGYHGGVSAAGLPRTARLLAAADAYHAMTEPRPHREPMTPNDAADELGREASAGRHDVDSVAAVVAAAGQPPVRMERPAGLTEREAEVVGLVARGLQTASVARAMDISTKTADRHIQNAYRKLGVSTRAAAALFAMEHGLARWGELPIARPRSPS